VCDVECGKGEQTRERECIEPTFGGLDCEGDRVDIRECKTKKECIGNQDYQYLY
jgi:hypothetical protein